MEWTIWGGAAVSMLGLAGLVWCILIVAKARRTRLPEDQIRAKLRSVVPMNMVALFLSAIGLMMVVVGIILD